MVVDSMLNGDGIADFAAQCFAQLRPLLSCGGWVAGWLSLTFVYCVETAKDTAIKTAMEYE